MNPTNQVSSSTDWMMNMLQPLAEQGTSIAMKLLGALILWFIGRFIITMVKRMIATSMRKSKMDETLVRYVDSAAGVLMNILLILAVLSVFGVETTTFAGLLAAAGVAIGMAWSGLLSNFAAGAFMVVLRPFAVDDFVEAGGVVGTVKEIGLFVTVITTMDNVTTYVGNNKIFSGNIKNFSDLAVRRVDLKAQLAHDVDVHEAIALLKQNIAKIPNVSVDTPPDIHILEFNLAGPVLCVRPYTNTNDYWQVYFDTNMAIVDTFGAAGFPVPEQHYNIKAPVPAA